MLTDVTKHYLSNRVVNGWNSLPDTVVTAPSSLSFRRQLAKFDLSSFCVNFQFSIYLSHAGNLSKQLNIFSNFLLLFSLYIYILLCYHYVIAVLSMDFIGVSGLSVLPLSIKLSGLEFKADGNKCQCSSRDQSQDQSQGQVWTFDAKAIKVCPGGQGLASRTTSLYSNLHRR